MPVPSNRGVRKGTEVTERAGSVTRSAGFAREPRKLLRTYVMRATTGCGRSGRRLFPRRSSGWQRQAAKPRAKHPRLCLGTHAVRRGKSVLTVRFNARIEHFA
jgi:hypothetical protein